MKRAHQSISSRPTWLGSVVSTLCVSSLVVACGNSSGDGFAHMSAGDGGADGTSGEDNATEDNSVADAKLAECNVPPMQGRVVIGYVPSWVGDFEGLWNSLDFDTLTHINLAFTNPTAVGGTTELPWVEDDLLKSLVEKAHAKNVKVMASLGGINDSEDIAAHLAVDMEAYIDDLENFVEKFDLDGVDVDIEGHSVDANYGPFVHGLANRLRPKGKLITAAVGGWFQEGIVDEALFCFDFINEMAYDAAGGWSGPGEHAGRAFARQRLNYWNASRGYPKERIVMGVPFYGYCWGTDCRNNGSQMRFSSIKEQFPDGLESDWIRPADLDLQINYNSPATLTYKAEYSQNFGGIMIWDMSQDDADQTLMKAIKAGLE